MVSCESHKVTLKHPKLVLVSPQDLSPELGRIGEGTSYGTHFKGSFGQKP